MNRCQFSPRWAAILIAALVGMIAAGAATAQAKSRLAVVLERGKLIVATMPTVPPFAMRDEKGELVGFDIDVTRLLLKRHAAGTLRLLPVGQASA